MTVEERFWAKVDKGGPASHWLWTAYTRPDGYGTFSLGGQTLRAHRLAWQLCEGEIPKGLCVLHTCDVRNCLNPAHL